jgi:uncharacterized membrane protein
MSCCIAGSVIMMSQNRQEEKDRERAKRLYDNLNQNLKLECFMKTGSFNYAQQEELIEIQKLNRKKNDILSRIK